MRIIAGVCGLAVLMCASMYGSVSNTIMVTDDFNSSHDYKNVASTIRNGVMYNDGEYGEQNEEVSLANANITNPGRLTIQSKLGNWEKETDDGFFLYRNVWGDFTATVQVIDANNVDHYDLGLMARVADIEVADDGEDYVAGRYYRNGELVALRSTDDSITPVREAVGELRPCLRLQRTGNRLTFMAVAGANLTVDRMGDSITRNDLDGRPVQVGIFQATFSNNVGTEVFDNFSLT